MPSGSFLVGAERRFATAAAGRQAPLDVSAGTTVNFDASGIDYLGGATQLYGWDFGTGIVRRRSGKQTRHSRGRPPR